MCVKPSKPFARHVVSLVLITTVSVLCIIVIQPSYKWIHVQRIIQSPSNSRASKLYLTTQFSQSGDWQRTRSGNAYLYSAHYDSDSDAVRLVSAMRLKGYGKSYRLQCRCDRTGKYSPMSAQWMPTPYHRQFATGFFLCKSASCKLSSLLSSGRPFRVLVDETSSGNASSGEASELHFPIIGVPLPPTSNTTYRHRLAICLPLLFQLAHNNQSAHYSKLDIFEFVHFYRLNGATRFDAYYDHLLTPRQLLSDCQEAGIHMHPWSIASHLRSGTAKNLRTAPGNTYQVHYYAQEAAINDCLYRRRTDSHWAAVIDLDEFIVVRQERSLLRYLAKYKTVAGVKFRNAHFSSSGHNMPVNDSVSLLHRLKTFRLTQRVKNVPKSHYGRLVVRPQLVEHMWIDALYRVTPRCKCPSPSVVTAPLDEALKHHYRDNYNEFRSASAAVSDKSARPFARRIAQRLGNWTVF